MIEYRKIEPVDVLYFRGNRHFSGPGVHGSAEMPPWPSVFAGAVASRILADHNLLDFIAGHPDEAEKKLAEVAGEDFSCAFLALTQDNRIFMPLPADLVVEQPEEARTPVIRRVHPRNIPYGSSCSTELPKIPVLESPDRAKPVAGYWLELDGWAEHLQGRIPDNNHLIPIHKLWGLDPRLGIARDYLTHTAAEGKIYTTEAVNLRREIFFVAGFSGKNIPAEGLLRLGGEGRGARITTLGTDAAAWKELGKPQGGWPGFRMILTSPGIFPKGWLPPGCEKENDAIVFSCGSLRARLQAVAIRRPGTVSGWDIPRNQPKPAQKVAPLGSVYWFSVETGNTKELEPLWQESLYAALENVNEESDLWKARRREGFGRAWFGVWEPEE